MFAHILRWSQLIFLLINNIVSAGHALAAVKAGQVQYHHVQKAVKMSQKFINQVNRAEQINGYFN
jgi:hypothetical protein